MYYYKYKYKLSNYFLIIPNTIWKKDATQQRIRSHSKPAISRAISKGTLPPEDHRVESAKNQT